MKKTLLLITATALALVSCASCVKRQEQPASSPADERKSQEEAELKAFREIRASLLETITDEERAAYEEHYYLNVPIADNGESRFFCEYTMGYFYIACDTSKEYHTENPYLLVNLKDCHEDSYTVNFEYPRHLLLIEDGPYGEGNPPPPAPYLAAWATETEILFADRISVVFDDGSEYQFSDVEIYKIKRTYALVCDNLR